MSYQALYRKYRPKDFSSVRGQEHIVKRSQIRFRRTGLDMLICFAEREEPEKRRLPKFCKGSKL